MNIDMLWVLVAAALVFFMQAGFLCFEAGIVREKHAPGVAMKNVIDWIVVSLVFMVIGFGLMFGYSDNGFLGMSNFFLNGVGGDSEASNLGWVFYLYQLAFAGTALTIVSGAMAERTGFIPYLVGSIFIAAFIYPVFGYWVWGNAFNSGNSAWLADLGFMDFAGGTVVHSVGAWVALVGIWVAGPRLGRYNDKGEPRPFKSNNYALSVLGIIILWMGWWGFNGGSMLKFDNNVGMLIVNTNIAGAAAGFVAFFHCFFFQKKQYIYEKLLGGILGGLVAITACCNVITPESAFIIGAIAGVIHNYAFDLILIKFKLDDVVGAIPVHGFCGVFGTLAVALFGNQSALVLPRFSQLGVQFLGIAVCFFWTVGTSFVMYSILKATVGLRVSPQEEIDGIKIGGLEEEGEETEDDIGLDEAALRELMS